VKVLFVGEGKHDIGPAEFGAPSGDGRPPRGVVPALAARAVPAVDLASSRTLSWRDIPLLSREKRTGLDRKVKGAALVARRRLGCVALVCVHDRDGQRNASRLESMRRGANEASEHLPVVCALAVESIEAWTLGAPGALADELGLEPSTLRRHYDPGRVEVLHEGIGKAEKQPKALLEQIASEVHRRDGLDLRESVAAKTNVDELTRNCPEGFGVFCKELRDKLAPLAARQ
jgi:hypothetical protein